MKALTNGAESTGQRINRATVLSLVQRYKSIHHTLLSTKGGLYNTVYVWFSIEDLTVFLQDLISCNASGVRVYFGAINNPDNPAYHNKQTVAFVCTQQVDGTDCHVELIDDDDNTVMEAYNFGSLCPPECNHCSCEEISISKEAFYDTPCEMS